jgi:hypothetical protein
MADRQVVLGQSVLELVAAGAAWTFTTRETVSIDVIRFIRERSSTTEPSSACDPPHTPEPAPRGTTTVRDSDAHESAVATSAVLPGNTAAA